MCPAAGHAELGTPWASSAGPAVLQFRGLTEPGQLPDEADLVPPAPHPEEGRPLLPSTPRPGPGLEEKAQGRTPEGGGRSALPVVWRPRRLPAQGDARCKPQRRSLHHGQTSSTREQRGAQGMIRKLYFFSWSRLPIWCSTTYTGVSASSTRRASRTATGVSRGVCQVRRVRRASFRLAAVPEKVELTPPFPGGGVQGGAAARFHCLSSRHFTGAIGRRPRRSEDQSGYRHCSGCASGPAPCSKRHGRGGRSSGRRRRLPPQMLWPSGG
ncbi:hypothetical protein SAMN00790413_04302 [Deinococcus hopiensis KR-140]|uniref:Uncharacterized protein n=1 Tax=Deinococcus hopiensis KR-140 TaxID=695939 RepID=A0A1W1UQ27_9DEIO|nr:hypothetical protein SAMN00790413_04302 [Deinococcus hopiensis KR-140]